MNKITPQDIQEGVETVSASPESTWYKVVETLDNGDKLCLAIGMGEGFDEDTVCAKLGVLAGNSGMSDYVWDFVMPWNLGEGDNDTWDTEVSNPNESDAEWFNTQAEEMIRGFEDGTIGTSLVGSSRKAGKKRPVKSSVGSEEAQIKQLTNPETFWDDVRSIVGYGTGRFHEDWDIKHLQRVADKRYEELTSSRKPIQSMYVTEDISGNDLYTVLWSGGLSNFKSMVEDGGDPEEILDTCEMLLNAEGDRTPTLTDLNDLLWFDSETVRDYSGIPSADSVVSSCHGKSKKKGKKKAVKSAMQISEIHNNTSNLYARIVYCDLESDVTEFNEEELIPIYEFKEQLRGYAESTNGWYTVKHRDDGYEPGEYYVTFTNSESEGNDPDSPDYDPYLENELGSLKFELVCDAGDELCNYLEDDRM